MKLAIFLIIAFNAPLLCSCTSYKSLTKREAITQDFLSRLEPGKKYKFKLKMGLTQIVEVKQVGNDTITGYIYQDDVNGKMTKNNYSETFERIEQGVAEIAVRKLNPYLTGVGIFLIVLPTAAIIWAETAW